MRLLIHIVVKIAENKCVETIDQPPKGITYGEDIVQTTTRKRPWRHGVVRKSPGRETVWVRVPPRLPYATVAQR